MAIAILQSVRPYGRYLNSLDPRSLACFRLLTGAVLLHDVAMAWDSLDHWAGLQAYYDGLPLPILPFSERAETTLALLFVAYGATVLAFLVGFRTRLSTFAAWVFVCAHHYAVRYTGDYHDLVLTTLLFWCLFVDIGRCWSVDAWLRRRRGHPVPSWSPAERWGSAALGLNVAYIYLSTVLLKTGSGWWQDGTAVFFALKDFALASDLGTWLVENAPFAVWRVATHAVVASELIAPLLLLSPWHRFACRLTGCLLLLALQTALWILMDLEAFPLTMIAAVFALLPARVWDAFRAGPHASTKPTSPPLMGAPKWGRLQTIAILLYLFVNLESHRVQYWEDDWPYPGSEALVRLQHVLGMELVWKMYAPEPIEHCGWWVGVGLTEDGREIDPITGRRPTLAKPSLKVAPFSGLGGLYWFEAPSNDGWPHNNYAHYLLWQDERANPPERQLSHFMLLYMHERYWPLQNRPHPATPLLVMRWPDDQEDPPPALTEDSVLRGLEVFEAEFGKMEKGGWQPRALPPLSTY